MVRIIAFLLVLLPVCAAATVIHVPSDQPTIQAGIDAASDGDTVLVAPGVYTENIDFTGKTIVVCSNYLLSLDTADIVSTVIDGNASGAVVTFSGNEGTETLLCGFSITNGTGHQASTGNYFGGGIAIIEGTTASPQIRSNYIYDNTYTVVDAGGGGGIGIFVGTTGVETIRIEGNRIYQNTGNWHAAAIYVQDRQNVVISQNLIYNNALTDPITYSAAVEISRNSSALIENNTIVGNNATALGVSYNAVVTLRNNVLAGNNNSANGIGGVYVRDPGQSVRTILHNCLHNAGDEFNVHDPGLQDTTHVNANGTTCDSFYNIFADPLLTDSSAGDYGLQWGSPCIDAGDPDTSYLDPNGSVNDMGALCYSHGPMIHVAVDGSDSLGDGSESAPFATIQRAVNVAVSDDTVLVESGTYLGLGNRDLDLLGKSITVKSSNGWAFTTIDCEGSATDAHRAFHCHSGETSACVVEGFTIANGYAVDRGGAVYCAGGSPTFRSCCFVGNEASATGGAIYTYNSIVVDSCLFVGNVAHTTGGAITDRYAASTIQNSFFIDNLVDGGGGGIHVSSSSTVVRGCTFIANQSNDIGSAINLNGDGSAVVDRCVFAYNGAGGAITCEGSGHPAVSCSNFYGNEGSAYECFLDQLGVNGNFSADPMFCDTANNVYTIYDASPCAPENNSCGVLIGAYGVGCYAPVIDSVRVDTVGGNQHVLSAQPLIQWPRAGKAERGQTAFEIAVGTDDDWQYAEMWNPAPVVSADTAVVYQGAALVDGATYHLRLRVKNEDVWSDWYNTTFRMNSAPGVPTPLRPKDWAVTNGVVTLWLQNAVDAESDPLTYEYTGFHDTDCVACPPIDMTGVPSGEDSTGSFIDLTSAENHFYCWWARAYDGFEYGPWSTQAFFTISGTPEAPTTPDLISPVDPPHGILYDMKPEFLWSHSYDPDPSDTVRYRLQVAIDPGFVFAMTVDSLTQNRYTPADSLDFHEQYWWRVTAFDRYGLQTMSPSTGFWTWTLGDVDYSHETTMGDLTVLIDHLFISYMPIEPMKAGDLDGDCAVTMGDLTTMIDHLFISYAPLSLPGCQ